MTHLIISKEHIDENWSYASNRSSPDPSHSFQTAFLDISLNPGELLYLLPKFPVKQVHRLKLDALSVNLDTARYIKYAVQHICDAFSSVDTLEILSIPGTVQFSFLNSFNNQLTHLILHAPAIPQTNSFDLSFPQLQTLVVVDIEKAMDEPFSHLVGLIEAVNLRELCIVGNVTRNIIPVREFVRRYSSSIEKLAILDRNAPVVGSSMTLPPLPRLQELEFDVAWAAFCIGPLGNLALPALKTLAIQSEVTPVCAGLTGLRWDVIVRGLEVRAVEEIRVAIRGGSSSALNSFMAVLRERLWESSNHLNVPTIVEGECQEWPEPGKYMSALANQRQGWRDVRSRSWSNPSPGP
ncbi:hypothetical protein PM082_022254 [Marasmius tenuissimus]|nr:hypothetical protein PM082_022254 [Marasmius tenuissimus]